MSPKQHAEIRIQSANTHNLKDISLNIPHHQLIVVTGISGSGKSSLVFDTIAKEGQRRYFETLPSFARQFMGKLNRPEVDQIEGLSPVITIGQRTSGIHARSTVGTVSDLYDSLRLLFARTGKTTKDIKLSRALFSFNSDLGKCDRCKGIGQEEQIDLNQLIAFPDKTIRDGALAPTLPTGYIMYSQVTMEVLNQVCEAEGFHVDLTWNELSDAQKKVILFGSEKIKVPFGKHSLESRLKWTGIKAKPREEGHYKGMIPIMSDILRRDRNANILKYVHAVPCESCDGARLNEDARSVTVQGKTITDLIALEINELLDWIQNHQWRSIAQSITLKIVSQINGLQALGLGHLTLDRSAKSLSPSEIQRIRIANQLNIELTDVLYIFDEPSIGLHHEENQQMIVLFHQLVQAGNTVIVVEHDLDTIAQADHLIEIGPQAGHLGGDILYNAPFSEFLKQTNLRETSPTYRALTSSIEIEQHYSATTKDSERLQLKGCSQRNLKNIDADFQLGKLNVVSGPSGSGKSSLVKGTLLQAVEQHLGAAGAKLPVAEIHNVSAINKLVYIDHSPIGKTPRSNPATYLGIADHIRDAFALLPEAKNKKYTKSRFSFNNKGGRCESCQGAGKTQIGMHFLGQVDVGCETCDGKRFNEETLAISYNGLSIADVYQLSITEAITFFQKEKKIVKGLQLLEDIGLGYLSLGQSSSTLSGGEAQRIKIANQLQKKDTGKTLYVIIEPSIGLHHDNIQTLLGLFDEITKRGNTIVAIDQKNAIIQWSDWHIELGPSSGKSGGSIVHQGAPVPVEKQQFLTDHLNTHVAANNTRPEIDMKGVSTHSLKNISVRIPKNQLTVVTGVSGSGKSSLVYDTLFAESHARFSESLSTYHRTFIDQSNEAKIDFASGLSTAIGINRKKSTLSKRSTVGTFSGVYDVFRLLFSRLSQQDGGHYTAQHFSFNHHLGACTACNGLGVIDACDPELVITDPNQSIVDGAMSDNKALQFYADPAGQFIATLQTVAEQKDWSIDQPWHTLTAEVKQGILYGTGDDLWPVTWEVHAKTESSTQSLNVPWLGFCHYIDDEYQRRLHNKNIKALETLMHHIPCGTCQGSRLKHELLATTFLDKNIHEWTKISIDDCLNLLSQMPNFDNPSTEAIAKSVLPKVLSSLQTLSDLGLGYLALDRTSHSLSGGERQRLTLASQLSTHLYGVTYVLDEPTIGLDAHQINVLIRVLRAIIANGNTVVVVEHDATMIQNSDFLIEMGPKSGKEGGTVIFQGKFEQLKKYPETVTHQMLYAPSESQAKVKKNNTTSFGIRAAQANNLKAIDVSFASQQLTILTGVSGSGKSSLIRDVLFESWTKKRPQNCDSYFGFEQFDDVIWIDHQPLTGNKSSTPAMYSGLLELVKDAFAKTEQAKTEGFKKADFSYLSKKGKCITCAGLGSVKTSMDFMSDLWLPCDSCKGTRYQKAILDCKYEGLDVGEVLQLTFAEAKAVFNSDALKKHFDLFEQLGIGHLTLGQAGNTLSGGERQRLKLATALLQKRNGPTLFLIDEPSTGLHYFDILKLLSSFDSILSQGHTIICIEHNETMMNHAGSIITLGPGCGVDGGNIIT